MMMNVTHCAAAEQLILLHIFFSTTYFNLCVNEIVYEAFFFCVRFDRWGVNDGGSCFCWVEIILVFLFYRILLFSNGDELFSIFQYMHMWFFNMEKIRYGICVRCVAHFLILSLISVMDFHRLWRGGGNHWHGLFFAWINMSLEWCHHVNGNSFQFLTIHY